MSSTEHTLTVPPPPDPDYWDGIARGYIPPAQLRISPKLRLHDRQIDEIDPITHEVVRYSLMNANFEHSAMLQRLCVAPATMLAQDFQVSILTELGDIVFLGPNIQYFSNSHSLSIKWMLENRSDEPGIGPGDIFLTNDVFIGAPHQPDTCMAAPVFVDDELFCWIANSMHLSDVGGSLPGSFCIDAEDTWGEPLNWPPVKIVEGGKLRPEIEELFARQSRVPVEVRMDMHAAMAALETTREKMEALIGRYGADLIKAVMHRTLDAGESLLKERLQPIPDGRWSHRAYTEAAVPGDRAIYRYQINVTKEGDQLFVDNVGTDPQAGSINITYAAFAGAVLASLAQQVTSDLAGAYGGVYRCVDFRPESGLLNCCDYPAAVSPSGALTTEMALNCAVIAFGKMLSSGDETTRELVLGPNIPHFYTCIAGGLDENGKVFIFPNTDGMIGALGGMPNRDGIDSGGHFWIPGGSASNVESFEHQLPMVWLHRRLLDGGADGAGRHRGGLGFAEAIIPWNSRAFQPVLYQNESFTKSQGQFGANPGTRAWFRCITGTDLLEQMAAGRVPATLDEIGGDERPAGFKGPPFDLAHGDIYEWATPSTAGFGDPLRRDPDAVRRDIEAHLIAPEAAERAYGVRLRESGEVDVEATASRRIEMREERLGGTIGEPVEAPEGSRRVGELLHVVDGRWWCNGADFGPVGENYKKAAILRQRPARQIAPEFEAADHEMADKVVFREYLCPVTGYRIDTELAAVDDPPLQDIIIR